MEYSDSPLPGQRIAYLGRVSTPRQRLEHQRETVFRWAAEKGIVIPDDLVFEDKVRRHKQAAEGANFARLMKLVQERRVDWVVIATFDRWGITNKEDIFLLRKHLMQCDVQLWSVADELNITGADDSSFWRVAARAEGATAYVSSQAEKNIQKMVYMAEQGMAASGNAPYGLDLVCFPLGSDRPLFRVVRMKYIRPHQYRIIWYGVDGRVEKEEVVGNMPARDKKATVYRLRESVETERLDAVRVMFDLYDAGLSFSKISRRLWEMGHSHYGNPFRWHAIETILANTAYIGMPAWGKKGVGQYRIALDKKAAKVRRSASEPFTIKKPENQFVRPHARVFEPVVDIEVFERVKQRLRRRGEVNPNFGARRERDKSTHPLNGKLVCPECQVPMGVGTRNFQCCTYRKSMRIECHANTVPWGKLDRATNDLLEVVADRIESIVDDDMNRLRDQAWLRESEIGRLIDDVVRRGDEQLNSPGGRQRLAKLVGVAEDVCCVSLSSDLEQACRSPRGDAVRPVLDIAFAEYGRAFETQAVALREELRLIDAELEDIALELIRHRSKPTIYGRLELRAEELEARRAEIVPKTAPLTEEVRHLLDQLRAIRRAIRNSETGKKAKILDSFLERVEPVFEVTGTKDRRAIVRGFKFIPRKGMEHVMPEAMELGCSRKGRD